MNYYNEIDPGAAAWLRQLIAGGHIPFGIVDTRSIVDVKPSDLAGFTQCHFFAGIAGWSVALQLAGIPSTTRCWTGSPPCQPYSVAGKQLGFEDPRHLAPAFLDLIAECRPPMLFGEQVRNAIGKHWLDFIFMDMEAEGYFCGASVLPAGGQGAFHQRDRLVFGAVADTYILRRRIDTGAASEDELRQARSELTRLLSIRTGGSTIPDFVGASGMDAFAVADGRSSGSQGRLRGREDAQREVVDGHAGCDSAAGQLDDAERFGRPAGRDGYHAEHDRHKSGAAGEDSGVPHTADGTGFTSIAWSTFGQLPPFDGAMPAGSECAGQGDSFWSGADWIRCRDGSFRPVESGTFPLANGVPARVGRLRGYGNAIVPQVCSTFISEFVRSVDELTHSDI